jgi:drug/metabolite transporter (DMT)-like permease
MELIMIVLNSWQFNVIAAVGTMVLYVQYYKLAVKDTQKESIATIILEFIGGISALLLVPFFIFKFSLDFKVVLLFILANIFYTLSDRIKTVSRKNLEVSIFSIIDQLSKVFLIVYGIILFHNPIIITKLLGGALIIFGNVALFYHRKRFIINKYVLLSVLASFLIATALIIDIDISKRFNLPFYVMLTLIIPAIFNYALERCPVKEIINEFNTNRKKYYIICGLVSGPMIFFTIRALQLGQVAFIAPLLATAVLLNVLIASIIHQEKTNLIKKIAVAIIIIIGIYLTVV